MLCLKAIADLPCATDATVARVAEMVQLSAPTVSRILDRLERDGYLLRERSTDDRRKVCLTLTEFGRKKLRNLPTPLQEQFLERLRDLDREEVQQLLTSLERIVQLMDAEDIDASPLLTPQVDVDIDGNDDASNYPE
ncbi:MarR family transcriptional regulator [Rubinisphaera sp. ICM_H10]|nr:MarR family transcriptional regulator [Rubinisphaera margarita]